MAKKKSGKVKPLKAANKRLPMAALMQLNEAQIMASDGDWEGARELLADLNPRYPRRAEILEELAYATAELKDARGLQSAILALLEVAPDTEADWLPPLAQAYLINAHPALALQTYDDYLQRFPFHQQAAEVRKAFAEMQPRAQQLIESLPFPAETRAELALKHDELNVALESGELERAETVAKQLLEAAPDFVPALNNLSQAQWLDGRREAAIASAQKVLEAQPDNVHALGNLVRFYVLQGQTDEAARTAELLMHSKAQAFEGDFKKAEALAYLGDDAAILALYDPDDETPASDFLHLVGVATARQGQFDKARKLWKQALKTPGALADVARANLSNLDLPEGERLAPWYLGFAQWIERETLKELETRLRTVNKGKPAQSPAAIEREVRAQQQMFAELFAKHPGLESCLIAQLNRGDAAGIQLALMGADLGRTPQLLEATRDFSLGRPGSDDWRREAARIASESGLLPSGLTKMWAKGEQHELILTNYQITTEPTRPVSAGNRKASAAIRQAMKAGDFADAETLSRAALEKYPNDIALRYNLSQSLLHQGRDAQALEVVRAIHADDPDYVFARLDLARRHTEKGETEAAHALLDPIAQRSQFHASEFALWLYAQINLLLSEDNLEGARSWLQMWESMSEQLGYEHPALEVSLQRVKKAARGRK